MEAITEILLEELADEKERVIELRVVNLVIKSPCNPVNSLEWRDYYRIH